MVTFDVPEHLSDVFHYLPGQHVTVRAEIDGEDVRRSYSICSNAVGGKLRVGIKRLPGGVFSAWAIDELRAGDVLEVMPPVGEFTIDPDPATPGIGSPSRPARASRRCCPSSPPLSRSSQTRHGLFSTGTERPTP